jgi:hypothetical protein
VPRHRVMAWVMRAGTTDAGIELRSDPGVNSQVTATEMDSTCAIRHLCGYRTRSLSALAHAAHMYALYEAKHREVHDETRAAVTDERQR